MRAGVKRVASHKFSALSHLPDLAEFSDQGVDQFHRKDPDLPFLSTNDERCLTCSMYVVRIHLWAVDYGGIESKHLASQTSTRQSVEHGHRPIGSDRDHEVSKEHTDDPDDGPSVCDKLATWLCQTTIRIPIRFFPLIPPPTLEWRSCCPVEFEPTVSPRRTSPIVVTVKHPLSYPTNT